VLSPLVMSRKRKRSSLPQQALRQPPDAMSAACVEFDPLGLRLQIEEVQCALDGVMAERLALQFALGLDDAGTSAEACTRGVGCGGR
jgi:hypothetical protein